LLSAILGTFVVKSTRTNIEYKEIEIEYNAIMFTLNQIDEAHASVKSGADFPKFAHDIRELGVTKYDAYVTDGHAEYFGTDGFTLIWPAHHPVYTIAETSDADTFAERLKAHQRGETDYFQFSQDAANAGVEKWTVDTEAMTCIYYDKTGKVMLEEEIPRV
jgi:uncharacterized protein YbcV (DUF1398 family)